MEPTAPRRRHRRPPAAEVTPETPIWCPACQRYQPASDFNRESRRYSGLSNICRVAWARKRQEPNERLRTAARNKVRWADRDYRERTLEASRTRRKTLGQQDLRRARARLQRIVEEWKRDGCVDCGYDDIRAIDPDHVDPLTKFGHLSRMVQMCASAARIRAELQKCVPRCARCHRLRTQQQRYSKNRRSARIPPSWARRIQMQDANDVIKMANGCTDCGWAEWARGLDWDHIRGPKVSTMAILIGKITPWTDVLAEMAKCEVVCANCHRIRTVTRGHYRRSPRTPAR